MLHPTWHWLLPAAFFGATMTAQAQSAAPAKPDPLDPEAAVPSLPYESSFNQYRRLGDERSASWREANDTVSRIGGWRTYAREAQQPASAPAAKPGQPATPAEMPKSQGQGDRKTP